MTVKPVHVRMHLLERYKLLFNPTEIRLEIINNWKLNMSESSSDVYSIKDPLENERIGAAYF